MKLLFNIAFYVAFLPALTGLIGGAIFLSTGDEMGLLIGGGVIAYSLVLLLGLTFMRLVERHLCKIEKSLRRV